jgi:hypothetical protein
MTTYTSTITPELAAWHQAALRVIGDDDLGQAVAWACTCFDVVNAQNLASDFNRHIVDALLMFDKLSVAGLLRFGPARMFDGDGVFVALCAPQDYATVH